PIVGLARTYALEAGQREGSTLSRLEAAAQEGVVSREGAETLSEAFRFLFRLRLRRQLEARREEDGEGNQLRLESL
ncbi:MAG: cyclic nucleotide-binding protein, partial [Acidobacteria bacterium]|nr:cyclic nucleotide-binding protein [Acidobacteriota bacterium]